MKIDRFALFLGGVVALMVALVIWGVGASSETIPPGCHREFSHYLTVWTGKATILMPQYETVCEASPTP